MSKGRAAKDDDKRAAEAETPAGRPGDGRSETAAEASSPHPWEAHLAGYPLRPPDRDPRWAVRTVWAWVGVALFSLAFILALLVLGWFYD